MIPYRSQRLMAVPKNLETQIEIRKAIHSLFTVMEKYDPDQPRIPAGNPDGGQWTGEGAQPTGQIGATPIARRISPELLAECEEQYERDLVVCRMVGLSSCYQQALLRRSNCERGLHIPPLNF
jgi:hypothetical protein